MITVTQSPPLPESPFPGIDSFRFIDQQIFSARKNETWNLLRNLLIYRGVLLYGDSSAGKSSLVNAGVTPAALEENLISNRLRIQLLSGKEIKVERISVESEGNPPYLPSVFVEKESSNGDQTFEISLGTFRESLQKFKGAASDEPRPLLIFDQFEELITLFEEALRGGETPEAKIVQKEAPIVRKNILDTITSLIEDDELAVKILFVFREDYLAKLTPLFEICPELLNQYVRLLPPRVEEAEEIIRAPFISEGLRKKFIKRILWKDRKEISSELAAVVAKQLQDHSDSGFINLPELQIVCRHLWQSGDPTKFFNDKDQDIQKVVEDYWTGVLTKLGDLYDPAIALLGHMVTSSNTRNIVSEPDLKSREKDNFNAEQIDGALKALVERKLVRREPRNKIYFYEIAGEFLVPWIQQRDAARRDEIRARVIAAEARQFAEVAREELKQSEKQRRNLMLGAGVLGFLLVVAIGLMFYAWYLRSVVAEALVNSKNDQNNLQIYGTIIRHLNGLTNESTQVRVDSVKELVRMDQQKQLPPELVPVIIAVSSKDESEDVARAASYFFSLAIQNSQKSGVAVSILMSAEDNPTLTATNELQPRVYIQIASDNQRSRADKLVAELKDKGFTVPGLGLVDSRQTPSSNQLRYYKSPDGQAANEGEVDKLLEIIKAKDGPKWSKVALNSSSGVRPGHYEIWFATDKSETRGTVLLQFEDENGVEIDPKKFTVTLTSSGRSTLISKNSTSVSAPAGTYTLRVRVPGYALYQHQTDIEIAPEQENSLRIKLIANKTKR